MIKSDASSWLEWQKSRSQRKGYSRPFIGSRNYPHFDSPISLTNKSGIGKLMSKFDDPAQLAMWSFFPFVKYTRNIRRFRFPPTDSEVNGVASPVILPPPPSKSRNQKKFTHLKTRPLMAAAHQDACVFSLYNHVLEKTFESSLVKDGLTENVLAYRSLGGRNNVSFAHDVFEHISEVDNVTCLLIDISGFFDTVNHKNLTDSIERISPGMTSGWYGHVLRNVTQYRYVLEDEVIKAVKAARKPYHVSIPGTKAKRLCKIEDYKSLIDNKKFIRQNKSGVGIPQGSPVSGLLANIYLNEFDKTMAKLIEKMEGGYYRRYSDDILVVCPTSNAKGVYMQCKKLLADAGLKIKGAKTEAFDYKNGRLVNSIGIIEPYAKPSRDRMQYLGLEWDGKQIILRPGTVVKRFRPKKPTKGRYWQYGAMAIRIIRQKGIRKQNLRIRRTVKNKDKTP